MTRMTDPNPPAATQTATRAARAHASPRKRHHWILRVTHWVNVVAIIIMVGSGLRIFNAYPAFARKGEVFCCYPFEHKPIPDWLTFGGWLGRGPHWPLAVVA